MPTTIIGPFSGEFRFLSNFWVDKDGFCVEKHYQASKTNDPEWKQRILNAKTPGEAKRLGRSAPIRPDWESVKLPEMEGFLRHKFSRSPLREQLLDTYPHQLVELNTWGDFFWGVCRGMGKNHLGRLLMKIREEATQ